MSKFNAALYLGSRKQIKAMVALLYFCSSFAVHAQTVFDEFQRNLYRDFLRGAIELLNEGNKDIAALNSVRNAFDNMERSIKKYGAESAEKNRVQPGYEPKLNQFVGKIAGFTSKVDSERAEREGQEGGMAVTAITFFPTNRANSNDVIAIGIMYGVSEGIMKMVRNGILQKAVRSDVVNGYQYSVVDDRRANSEKVYFGVLEDRILVFGVSNDVGLARTAIEAIDMSGLIAFRQ